MFRDRDKMLRCTEKRDTGQAYIDELMLDYNYSRPHVGLDDKTSANAARVEVSFNSLVDIATMEIKS